MLRCKDTLSLSSSLWNRSKSTLSAKNLMWHQVRIKHSKTI